MNRLSWINRQLRGRKVSSRIVFGGGYPKFRWMPKAARWGCNLSVFWLGTELVFLGRRHAAINRDRPSGGAA